MVLLTKVWGRSGSASDAASLNGQRSSLPETGNLCSKQACRTSSEGCVGTPCRSIYPAEATSTCPHDPRRRDTSRESSCSPVRMTASKPSSMISTMRSEKSTSISISGYCVMKPSSAGMISQDSCGVLIRNLPRAADSAGQFGFRRFELTQDAAAPFQEQRTFSRQRDATRAAVKESHAQAVLDTRNTFADRRRRHAEQASRLGKTAGLRHLHKYRNTTEAIHRRILGSIRDICVRYIRNLSLFFFFRSVHTLSSRSKTRC